jgi:Protein of unknown function (DUF3501)
LVHKLAVAQLMSLEQYARERPALRAGMIEHRRERQLQIGGHCTWSFEDRRTVQYQVQEMLRSERIFEPEAISEELQTYNPLIPDGSNLKATLMIEYADPAERAERLVELRGFERHCWMSVAGFDPVYAIADEDLPRENDEKTSAVHFLRFELQPHMLAALKAGASLSAGVDHDAYRHSVEPLAEPTRASLLGDLN